MSNSATGALFIARDQMPRKYLKHFNDAMRGAVLRDRLRFVARARRAGVPIDCAICGQSLNLAADALEVDHGTVQPYFVMRDAFLTEYLGTFGWDADTATPKATMALLPDLFAMSSCGARFKDTDDDQCKLRDAWVAYHRKHATLSLTHAKCNNRQGARGAPRP
jgi:hypothetical protein